MQVLSRGPDGASVAAAQDQPDRNAARVTVRPELEPVLGLLSMMIDEMRSVVVHLTATRHGEGTTTLARELALAAASTGWCKVALIDARPRAGRAFEAGLVEAIDAGREPELRPAGITGAPYDTAVLSGSPHGATRVDTVRRLYATLRAGYALVLVDCPPVFAGRQAAVIAGLADCAVLVVEAERTPAAEIVRAREALEQMGAKLLGVVLNKTRDRMPRLLGRFF